MADDSMSAAAIFPTEIFRRIIYHVAVSRRRPRYPDLMRARHRLQKLRLVFSEFSKLAADHLFELLKVVTGNRPPRRDLWQALADGTTGLGPSVRRLDITLGDFHSGQSKEQLREAILQEMDLLEVITRAIPRLSLLKEATINLVSIGVMDMFTPNLSSRGDIVHALTALWLPREPLTSLTIISNNTLFPSVLDGFTNLRTLRIRNPLEADVVSALIADNPHLSTLNISGHFIFSIGDMLPSLPPDTDRHRLKVLHVKNFTFLRDNVPVLVPFIQAVKHLVFMYMSDISDDLWAELHRHNAPLRTLSISHCLMYLSEPFVAFISSCDGLKQLKFTSFRQEYGVHGNMSDPSPGTVRRFWFDALPGLASSLRELDINGPENSGLCIHGHIESSGSPCGTVR